MFTAGRRGWDLASATLPREGPILPVSTFDCRLRAIFSQGPYQPACACEATRVCWTPRDVLKGTRTETSLFWPSGGLPAQAICEAICFCDIRERGVMQAAFPLVSNGLGHRKRLVQGLALEMDQK